MQQQLELLGLMSGSSLDGLDLAYCRFKWSNPDLSDLHWELQAAETVAYTSDWQKRLAALPEASALELARTDAQYGRYLGALTHDFLRRHDLQPDAIASHGHTIFHVPAEGFTTQIGDGAAIAAVTGHSVISDFRTADVAAGGQGAPLAAIADKWLFQDYDFCLNIGGIINMTGKAGATYRAFDITGANQVLNQLSQALGHAFDHNGALAQEGKILPQLLAQSNALPYLSQPYPKTLGNRWVRETLIPIFRDDSGIAKDKLRTACAHIAQQTAASILQFIEREQLPNKPQYRMLITGGGGLNGFLVNCIQTECAAILPIKVIVPERSILDFKEAILMALLGLLQLQGRPNCLASVTGAAYDVIGGAFYHGKTTNTNIA